MRLNDHQDIKSAATVPEILTALPECSFPYTTICTVSVGLLSLSDSSEVLLLSFLPLLSFPGGLLIIITIIITTIIIIIFIVISIFSFSTHTGC